MFKKLIMHVIDSGNSGNDENIVFYTTEEKEKLKKYLDEPNDYHLEQIYMITGGKFRSIQQSLHHSQMKELIEKSIQYVKGANDFLQSIFEQLIKKREEMGITSVWEDAWLEEFLPSQEAMLCMHGDEGILLVESSFNGYRVTFDALIVAYIFKVIFSRNRNQVKLF